MAAPYPQRGSAGAAGSPLEGAFRRPEQALRLVDGGHHVLALGAEERLGQTGHPLLGAADALDQCLQLGVGGAQRIVQGGVGGHPGNLSGGLVDPERLGSLTLWPGSATT